MPSIAVVTGGSRGIGKAFVDALTTAGVQVEAPTQADLDVRNADQVQAFLADVVARNGSIDLLINNAGWAEPVGTLEQLSEEAMNQCVDTNIKGVFHFLHAALPFMKKQKHGGMIINMGSRAGTRAHPGLAVYSATKFAVRGLTQAVARECIEANVPVTTISLSPGGVDTDMRATLFGKENSSRQQKPEVIAQILLQILRGELDVPTGADVIIVGGKVERIAPMDA